MRTNIVIDERLIARAMKRAGVKTMREMVDLALREYVSKPDYDTLLEMAGSGAIAPDYEPKAATAAPRLLEPASAPYVTAEPRKKKPGKRRA